MSTKKFLTVLCLTVLATAGAEAAGRSRGAEAPPPQLYTLDKAAPRADRPSLPNTAEEFLIQVAPAAVAANPSAFLVDLPGHAPLEAVRTDFVDYQGWKSWSGTLRHADNGEAAGWIDIGFHGDRITALVELEDGERYRIVGGPEEGQRLVRLDAKETPWSCGMDSSAEAVETPFLRPERRARAIAPLTSEKITSCSASPRIDLLAVYPSKGDATRNGYFDLSASTESALFTFVQNSITKANQVFANNGIGARYNLVGIVPLIDQESVTPDQPAMQATGLRDALDWMNEEHAELENLRNAFGADVVAVYIPWAWSGDPNSNIDRACAVANMPRGDGNFQSGSGVIFEPLDERAFTAHRDTCGLDDLTLAHEIGHNYGMWHDDPSYSSLIVPYARGYKFTDNTGAQRATVMGCNCTLGTGCVAGNFAVCNRISFFSDPDKTFNGVAVGTRDASGDLRHNARVACDRVTGYSNFRTQSTNTPPTASFTVSCTGRTCYFNANGTTDNAAIPSDNYWWDFGNGTGLIRAGRNVSYLYNAAGSYRVHLVVKDSGGQTDVVWSTANPWIPVHEGYLENANCRFISGWAWDQTHPNDSISVDIYRDGTYLSNQPANIFRQDLVNAGKGNGYHGFSYTPTNSWKDGNWHSAGVRFSGTNTSHLTWSPKSIICNARIFSNSSTPVENLSTGGQVYTVGLQFSSNKSGYITQLGFHRAVGETGSNTLRLWPDNGGTPLVSVTTNCTSSGWCWGSFSPIAITAGTRYRVTVNTNTYQSKTGCGIGSGITNDPLTAHNGYWIAGTGFPTGQGACNSNFFLDVKFDI